ncbi:MAG: HD domain-containing protein [Bradymonadales bacterium]|nr:HD domain-containing protein [Bradymonadales bacterium]
MPLPTREQAIELLSSHIATDYTLKHSLATEAIMRQLAERLGGDPDLWGITGLLHDLDLELVEADPQRHAKKTVEILQDRFDFPPEGLAAILAHNGDELDIPCQTDLESALTAAESITGLIFATALIYPSKKLAEVEVRSVRKRIKEKRFAAKISRERILHYQRLPMSQDEFLQISLDAMKSIADQLGL